ncbi:site-2 protease family protein [uncultured Methanosphaera sp.]|uniref:site-2 protease family protein n=1 Tax=uncultured Methanosphaera sp. TaxID=262501 RepID=UPI0025F4343E|nr:site-2 protease family protein [uncultured Methanosphaera sp.]
MVTFSKTEIRDLIISISVITILFAYMFNGTNGTIGMFLLLIPISLITVGLSFILHELGHKVVAQKYGFYAEFRRWDAGLILAIITSLFGFIFLAPGAVYIGSYTGVITEKENGVISIAGPLVNIGLALIFLLLGFSIHPWLTSANMDIIAYLLITCTIGFNINSFLALFNLLPIPMLDGSKVLKWNMPIWLVTIILSGVLTYLSYNISFI